MTQRDYLVLQFIAAVSILLVATRPEASVYLYGLFPYANIAMPTVAFVFLYRGLVWIYRVGFWRHFHRDIYLGGQWIYTLENQVTNRRVYGIFELKHTADELTVERGTAWYADTPPSTSNMRGIWTARPTAYKDRTLWIIFTMQTTTQDPTTHSAIEYRGTIVFTVVGHPPQELQGLFCNLDAHHRNHGPIQARRVKASSHKDLARLSYEAFAKEPDSGA